MANEPIIHNPPIRDNLRGADRIATFGDVRVLDLRPHLAKFSNPEAVEKVLVEFGTIRFSIAEARALAVQLQAAADYAESILGK